MASSRHPWTSVKSVLCCQSTKDGALEPEKKEQPPPCVSDGPVCPEDGVSLRPEKHQIKMLNYFIYGAFMVEWRNSVQPSLGAKLQLHLERSLLEKQELECRALRAEESIQDLKREIAVLQKRLQAEYPSPTTLALLATAPQSLPPSPSPPLPLSSIRLLLSKMHKKSAVKPVAQTPPKQGSAPCAEHVLSKQNSMKEVLDTIRRGVSLRPVCMSREGRMSRVEEAASLEYEQEPMTKKGSKSCSETDGPLDSSGNMPTSNQTLQPLGSLIIVPSSGTPSAVCASQAYREEDSCPQREQEDPTRSSEDDTRSATSPLPAITLLEEGDNLEEIPCGSRTSLELGATAQIPQDSEATDCSGSPSSKNPVAVGKENTEDEGEAETVAEGEMCEGERSAGPASEVAQPLGLGDQGSGETNHRYSECGALKTDLASGKHLSLAPLDASCPSETSPSVEDLLVRGTGQKVNAIAASCMDDAMVLKSNASQALSAEPTTRDLGLPEKQPPLCPVATEVETEMVLEGGDLGEGEKVPPASSIEPLVRSLPEGAEMKLEGGVGASLARDQSNPLKDSPAIAPAALPLPGAIEAPVPAGFEEVPSAALPDLFMEAGPADSKETLFV
ncbi:mitochondrial assembly of ribosomal large subunit protein 1 [Platysternon megacephalum]|uniref:Mitochondrial assembly of ribosomal large subunit protein 1 n=1 Tax=Platysternon megacephalum TaxID=55544 RepID=A0A4D9EC38_9SAUR|nr:mitochondrial assembly of ribosomal large subunit protein 1 [Platysternon megacephalum]